jgi:UDP-N-acetylmuramate--alanine ligase
MKDIAEGTRIYCVGIKGTGMAALAEYCSHAGALVEGSDVEEVFYTDAVLKELNIPVHAPFSATNLPEKVDLLFYSAAYDPKTHPELVEAQRRGLELHSYPEALGRISASLPTGAVSGVHGKTTTTAMAGTLAAAAGLPVGVLVGSAVANFNNRSCLFVGDRGLILETCEYRRHFLHISPRWLIVTSVEPDHLDYYTDYEDIFSAFLEYVLRLPPGGALIFCADDNGAAELAIRAGKKRPDLKLIPYGFSVTGRYAIESALVKNERLRVKLAGFVQEFPLRIPGRHSALNAAAAAALVETMAAELKVPIAPEAVAAAFEQFLGSKRRSEILGEADGILFMDDYAHHPTAIRTTLAGLKEFYPGRRIVADFMSHTYSRTEALLEQFASAFGDADLLILHEIYASAREAAGSVNGETLYARTAEKHSDVRYFEKIDESREHIDALLRPGDLFITMGAGNNFSLSHGIYALRKDRTT